MKTEPLSQEERSRLEARYDQVRRELEALPGRRKRRELTGQAYYKRRDELYKEREAIAEALSKPLRVRRKGDGLIVAGLFLAAYGGFWLLAWHLFDFAGPRYDRISLASLALGLVLVIVGIGRRRRWWLA